MGHVCLSEPIDLEFHFINILHLSLCFVHVIFCDDTVLCIIILFNVVHSFIILNIVMSIVYTQYDLLGILDFCSSLKLLIVIIYLYLF